MEPTDYWLFDLLSAYPYTAPTSFTAGSTSEEGCMRKFLVLKDTDSRAETVYLVELQWGKEIIIWARWYPSSLSDLVHRVDGGAER